MLVKEKQILETFGRIIPALAESDKSYLLGLGEGMARMVVKREADDKCEEKMKVRTAQSARKESESVDKKDEIEVKIHVDTTELVDAIEKANRLVCVLKEVNTLIHSLLGAEQSKT